MSQRWRNVTVLVGVMATFNTSVLNAQSSAGASKHQYVTEGLFDLKWGKSFDLTDRKVLMTFDSRGDNNSVAAIEKFKSINVLINGFQISFHPGKRLDLKRDRATGAVFADMAECYLDLIDITVPKGTGPTAHFRLNCH